MFARDMMGISCGLSYLWVTVSTPGKDDDQQQSLQLQEIFVLVAAGGRGSLENRYPDKVGESNTIPQL